MHCQFFRHNEISDVCHCFLPVTIYCFSIFEHDLRSNNPLKIPLKILKVIEILLTFVNRVISIASKFQEIIYEKI